MVCQAGTSGSGTRTNPYSLDAIQEVQVQLAPYDVKAWKFYRWQRKRCYKKQMNFTVRSMAMAIIKLCWKKC